MSQNVCSFCGNWAHEGPCPTNLGRVQSAPPPAPPRKRDKDGNLPEIEWPAPQAEVGDAPAPPEPFEHPSLDQCLVCGESPCHCPAASSPAGRDTIHCPFCDSGLTLSEKEVNAVVDLSHRLEVSPDKVWHMALASFQLQVLGEPDLGLKACPDSDKEARAFLSERIDIYPSVLEYPLDFEQVLQLCREFAAERERKESQ